MDDLSGSYPARRRFLVDIANYGFSDAAEFYVFGFIYTPIVRGGLFLAVLKRLWKRAGQL